MKHETILMIETLQISTFTADFAILFAQNRLLLQERRVCLVLSLRASKVLLTYFIKLKIIPTAFKRIQNE